MVSTTRPLTYFILALVASLAVPVRADEANASFLVASGHYARQRWEYAALEFAELLRGQPDHPRAVDARFYLGESLVQLGRYDEARDQFRAVLRAAPEGPHAPQALFRCGETAYLAGRLPAAASALDQLTRTFPGHPLNAAALSYLGNLDLRGKAPVRALGRFALALEVYPEAASQSDCFLGVAMALEQCGDAEGAARFYGQVAAGEASEAAPRARLRLGLLQAVSGRFDAALATLDGLEAWSVDPEWRTRVQFARGSVLQRGKRYKLAARQFDLVLDGPWADNALLEKIKMAAESGDDGMLESEAERFRRDFRASPLAADVQFVVASRYVGQQRYAAAVQPLEAYLEVAGATDKRPQCLGQLALCHARLGQWSAARARYQQLLDERAGAEIVLPTSLELAQRASAEGDWAWSRKLFQRVLAAASVYRQAVASHPAARWYAQSLLGIARLQADRGRLDEARTAYERLLRERPDFEQAGDAVFELAWLLRELGQSSRALALFGRLHDEYPASRHWPEATYLLAEAACDAKDYQRARELLAPFCPPETLVAPAAGPVACRVLYLRGQIAASEKQWDLVDKYMTAVVDRFPENELRRRAGYWAAEAVFRQEDHDRAAERFDRLLAETEGPQEAWFAVVPLRRAQIFAQQEHWPETMALARQILRDYPEFNRQYEVDYLIGRCHAGLGELDQARQAYLRVIRSPEGGGTKTAAMAQWMIGESYLHQKDYTRAKREFLRTEILYAYPEWRARALLEAGKCCELEGRWPQACELYTELLTRYRQTDARLEAAQRLHVAKLRSTQR